MSCYVFDVFSMIVCVCVLFLLLLVCGLVVVGVQVIFVDVELGCYVVYVDWMIMLLGCYVFDYGDELIGLDVGFEEDDVLVWYLFDCLQCVSVIVFMNQFDVWCWLWLFVVQLCGVCWFDGCVMFVICDLEIVCLGLEMFDCVWLVKVVLVDVLVWYVCGVIVW